MRAPQHRLRRPWTLGRGQSLDPTYIALLLACGLCAGVTAASAQSAKPRVPAGRDPGGIAIAVIGSGIDYTLSNIARRLARDGEGEFIAWDLIDGDNRPLDGGRTGPGAAGHWSDTLVTMLVLTDAPAARLVQARVPWFDGPATARALAFAAKTPARVVLLLRCCRLPEDWLLVREAALRYPELLLIVPADIGRPAPDDKAELLVAVPGAKATPGMPDNVLVVTCVEANGARCATAFRSATLVDVAVPGAARYVTLSDTGAIGTAGVRVSAAVAAALAVRMAEANPELRGAALKARIVAVAARPVGETGRALARHGVLLPAAP